MLVVAVSEKAARRRCGPGCRRAPQSWPDCWRSEKFKPSCDTSRPASRRARVRTGRILLQQAQRLGLVGGQMRAGLAGGVDGKPHFDPAQFRRVQADVELLGAALRLGGDFHRQRRQVGSGVMRLRRDLNMLSEISGLRLRQAWLAGGRNGERVRDIRRELGSGRIRARA